MVQEILKEVCCLAGYLLAHQAEITAEGEVAIPIALFTKDEKPYSPYVIEFKAKDNLLETLINNGRRFIEAERSQFRCWVFTFDVNLRSPSDGSKVGDALYVEAGGRGLNHQLEFMQQYIPKAEDSDFHLIGDVVPFRSEEWPTVVAEDMESIGWHDCVTSGARDHPSAGELWDNWHRDEIVAHDTGGRADGNRKQRGSRSLTFCGVRRQERREN